MAEVIEVEIEQASEQEQRGRDSLSIRRFWGKRGRREAKREGAKGKERLTQTLLLEPSFSSSPSPLPLLTSPLLSPSPLGRPDTQAKEEKALQYTSFAIHIIMYIYIFSFL